MATPPVLDHRLDLSIEGMTCASCANRIERTLNKLDGVEATVNFATETASVHFADGVASHALINAVESVGYKASLPTESTIESERETHDPLRLLRRRLVASAVLTVPVVALSMIPALQFDDWQWLVWQLTTPVITWGAWPFHRATLMNLRHGSTTMDTLISLGVTAAWTWSVVALFFLDAGTAGMKMPFDLVPNANKTVSHLYFEVAAAVTVFLLAGRYFEALAKRRSGAAMQALLELGARDVAVVDEKGVEQRRPIGALGVGDRFVVRPGEKVATDGVVEEGNSGIDLSVLTGESVPRAVSVGDEVVGATVNTTGRLTVRATKIGNDTMLGQIARLVSDAQAGKARVQRLADRISAVFVPIVLLLAALTLGYWLLSGAGPTFAFTAAVAVLIIACPCALGLATPTALLVGTGRGAQLGLLIKGPEVLESTRRVDTVVLDKTGTVTTGVMSLRSIHVVSGESEDLALKLVGSLEDASEHPLGRAIARAARERLSILRRVKDFENVEGAGVVGYVGEHRVVAGRISLLLDNEMSLSPEFDEVRLRLQGEGSTVVAGGWNGEVRALFELADSIKPTSREAVDQLKQLGLRPVLLTGDNAVTARAVAAAVGIDDVFAEVMPREKLDVISSLQGDGHVVAMIGDGVNDAPALAQADLGLSMGTGTDVAIEASDLTLVSGDLRAAVDAIRLSRSTLRTIKGNLFWAFAYNVAALPLAATGYLSPLLAGAAMALSSAVVVANSLRLRKFSSVRTH